MGLSFAIDIDEIFFFYVLFATDQEIQVCITEFPVLF